MTNYLVNPDRIFSGSVFFQKPVLYFPEKYNRVLNKDYPNKMK